jgi:hypothetical protein
MVGNRIENPRGKMVEGVRGARRVAVGSWGVGGKEVEKKGKGRRARRDLSERTGQVASGPYGPAPDGP